MATYTFQTLSDYDFELLVRDLLQRELGCRLENFKRGKDQGIDLRYVQVPSTNVIIQCKHYVGSGFAALLREISYSEISKVNKLNPSRYILATSVPLSPANKAALQAALTPFCSTPSDIFGQEDLNNLLAKFPDLETANFKLWLTSSAVLERVLNSAVFLQSDWEAENIKRRMKMYVQNDSFSKAQKILNQNHFCVIAGIPGIGKTTLAEMLIVDYINNGFKLIKVVSDIAEATALCHGDDLKVIYYDDFLGQSSLQEKFGKNEESALVRFMEMVRRSKHLRLILTTREYILNSAKAIYEPLARANIDVAKCSVKLEDYTTQIRAHILYNHLYFSDIPVGFKLSLLNSKTHEIVIRHANFNPRIIEMMSDANQLNGITAEAYPAFFLSVLADSSALWDHAFTNQLSNAARNLLYALHSLAGVSEIGDLEIAFEALHYLQSKHYNFAIASSDFQRALKELDGNFVKSEHLETDWLKECIVISYHNPSVGDFMNVKATTILETSSIIQGSTFFEQIWKIYRRIAEERSDANHLTIRLELAQALARTFFNDSKAILRPKGRERIYVKMQLNMVSKVKFLLERLSEGESAPLSALLETLLRRLQTDLAKTNVIVKARIVDAVKEATMLATSHDEILELIWQEITNKTPEFTDLEDFKFAFDFGTKYSFLANLPAMKALQEGFLAFAKDECDNVRDNYNDADQIRDYAGDLTQFGKTMKVNLDTIVEHIEERASSLEEGQNERDDYEANEGSGSGVSGELTSAEINSMFDTLRR